MKQDFFLRYLTSKVTVDDRALNVRVWQAVADLLVSKPLTVLEIGAGIGTMVERLAAHGLLDAVDYTAVDNDPHHISIAKERLHHLSQTHNLRFESADVLAYAQRPENQQAYDLIIAHAFLDLMDIPRVLPQIFSLLRSGGHFYFTINFDGGTIFEPAIEPSFDALVEQVYHRTMDERVINGRLSGDSKSGRHLFQHVRHAGGRVLSAGSSDWVVFAGEDGYPADEAFFLQSIVKMAEGSLKNRPELDSEKFAKWIETRLAQIERGELVYIAHQLDLFGQVN